MKTFNQIRTTDHSFCFSFQMMNTVFLSFLLLHPCLNFQFSGMGRHLVVTHWKDFHFLLQIIATTYTRVCFSIRFAHTEKHSSCVRVLTGSLYLRVKAAESLGSESQLASHLPHHLIFQLRLASTPRQRNLEFLDLVFLQNRS